MKYVFIVCLFLVLHRATAQSCTGGLGDPIVNITFGQGVAAGPALPSGVTNLNYIPGGCPTDGQYAIVSHTSGCWNHTWVDMGEDHTGNQSGYFMLINASYQPSDFYVQTINGLCGGTTYQFAAWVQNMAPARQKIMPNITFRIEKTDGTLLQSFTTGDIPRTNTVHWQQYAFYFKTPSGISSVVIRMTNNAPGGDGNDLALDDITFRAAGPAIGTTIAGFTGDSVGLCENDTRTLNIISTVESCFASEVYQWQSSTDGGNNWIDIPGANTLNYDRPPAPPGHYLYRLTVAESSNAGVASCRVASPPVTIDVLRTPVPGVTITPSAPVLCMGGQLTFTAAPTDGGPGPLYQWQVNGVSAGAGGNTFTPATLANSDVVNCVMTSNAACVTDPIAVSNSLTITVAAIPTTGVNITASTEKVCQDSLVSFTATPINGGDTPTYAWKINGAAVDTSTPVFQTRSLHDGDLVSLVMTGDLPCSPPVAAPEVIRMTIYPLPTVALSPDTVIAGGESIRLAPALTGNTVRYIWTPASWLDDPASPTPVATPTTTITYQLEVETSDGCRATGFEKVGVFYKLLLPDAFSPNGDGRNDMFRVPPSIAVKIHRLAVYNRDGAMLFSTANAGEGWDGSLQGRPQAPGVYIWMIEYDNPLTRRTEVKKGTVMLVR